MMRVPSALLLLGALTVLAAYAHGAVIGIDMGSEWVKVRLMVLSVCARNVVVSHQTVLLCLPPGSAFDFPVTRSVLR
jgi:hypothetical protein